jgi:hypothetical protein
MAFLLRDAGVPEAAWEERRGDLSLGGLFWRGETAPQGALVDVRLRLPGVPREVCARGELIRVEAAPAGIDFHVRFTELDVEDELLIAKYLDDWLAAR